MRVVIAITVLALLVQAESDTPVENIWAVLVAGSKGWENYRHQADVAHAYHVLINHGVSPNRIITFMYDDIANNPKYVVIFFFEIRFNVILATSILERFSM